jgi:hypothetical protein
MKRLLLLAAMLTLAVPAAASAGKLTLHPSGFGAHSYAAWKAHQGLPDTLGNDDQALYFQKQTATSTFAAGVAVIKGIAGTPLSELTGLAWDHREDGHCGAGAPRWNVTVQDSSGASHTVFLGCNAAAHDEDGLYGGHGWCRDSFPSPATVIAAAAGASPTDLTITSLAINFDEGNDVPNIPPPTGCHQEQFGGGFVHLDDITVQVSAMTHCWTGANDNGSGGASTCPTPFGQDEGGGVLIVPFVPSLALPVGLAVDPTDLELTSALNLAYPGVPLTSWQLYPNVTN